MTGAEKAADARAAPAGALGGAATAGVASASDPRIVKMERNRPTRMLCPRFRTAGGSRRVVEACGWPLRTVNEIGAGRRGFAVSRKRGRRPARYRVPGSCREGL